MAGGSQQVYPRTHGETLSPGTWEIAHRSIPVHTGKPSGSMIAESMRWVYPRTHGETILVGHLCLRFYGLSPYTRGNLMSRPFFNAWMRSIPVHTGKPTILYARVVSYRVYPRTHGETSTASQHAARDGGLSPYTRGNLNRQNLDTNTEGSIPVHTGKPQAETNDHGTSKVYPRTHGETPTPACSTSTISGLSPYTRGNHFMMESDPNQRRSIPVHTGKPIALDAGLSFDKVYPRTHGETTRTPSSPSPPTGLSPYTRGNLWLWRIMILSMRSIPVHTGKPSSAPAHSIG